MPNPRLSQPEQRNVAAPEDPPPFVSMSGSIHQWIEVPVGDSWIAAYRFKVQDNRPIIAELRVFPAEAPPAGGAWPPGTWSGTWSPNAPVPGRGITAGLVKNDLRISIPFDFIADARATAQEFAEEYYRHQRAAEERRGPGRKPLPPVFYARVARDYVDAIERGSWRPAQDVADARRISAGLVRAYLKRARDLGLLSAAQAGQPGGKLTAAARAVLDEARS
jgi:hypothetical protein